jgi:hypothetical protein
MGLLTIGFFFESYSLVIYGAPSLTRGRVCHVSVLSLKSIVVSIYKILHELQIYKCWTPLQRNKIYTIYTGLFQSRLRTADYVLLTSFLVYHGSFRHLNSRTRDRRQVWASYIFCVGSRLVQCCEHFHFHDFGWLVLVACMYLLCNHKRTEFGKPHAYRGPMCASENYLWCGEPYFAGAAISVSEILHKFPGGASISHYRSNKGFVESQFNVSVQSLTFE